MRQLLCQEHDLSHLLALKERRVRYNFIMLLDTFISIVVVLFTSYLTTHVSVH